MNIMLGNMNRPIEQPPYLLIKSIQKPKREIKSYRIPTPQDRVWTWNDHGNGNGNVTLLCAMSCHVPAFMYMSCT